jgi:hypothetical protein
MRGFKQSKLTTRGNSRRLETRTSKSFYFRRSRSYEIRNAKKL